MVRRALCAGLLKNMAMEMRAQGTRGGSVWALACVLMASLAHSAMAQCSPAESDALLKFKSFFSDPRNDFASWTGGNCCSWKGVQCSGSGVTGINLDFGAPSRGGPGAPSLLIWSDPEASFKAGEALSHLYQLQVLHTNWIIWNAPLPVRKFANLPLREIVVRNGFLGNANAAGGALGNDIGLFANSLEVLILQNTKYNIGLPSDLCKLKKLRVLEVSESHLPNVGPACLGSALNNTLQEVRVHSNYKITTGLPVWPTLLPYLKVLDFSNNAHSGNIPVQYGKLANVELHLGGNHLTGKLPSGLSALPESAFRPGNEKLCGAPLSTCPA
ncbi:uncharacterized protein [Physcomitrium patens]|uniref:Leucine-rich repeat-containing N-terminal plant-type domain-containing protein n=1 Tax=Physcomitrium patens TaxID=3218 RepID=A9RTH7_PHYPA|nr:probably inactive leucine-rich repeat receptor-like protein kinase At2g25790 isoform X1 [Physcomitrium patens]PNR31665.1 hypothetical protein PHYPA_025786 [Physcomitrium patens]|eukprot:XP_024358690.1 probably inactive leucine-rich repeat receptor-like protein kinase At2g25790 isoform X1 [Physcomitrella patens]